MKLKNIILCIFGVLILMLAVGIWMYRTTAIDLIKTNVLTQSGIMWILKSMLYLWMFFIIFIPLRILIKTLIDYRKENGKEIKRDDDLIDNYVVETTTIYRRESDTYHRDKFQKPLMIIVMLIAVLIAGCFIDSIRKFAAIGAFFSTGPLILLSLLYFLRPSKTHDKREYGYVQFKEHSLKASLRGGGPTIQLGGDPKKFLIEEIQYPQIKYRIFEIPYNEIISIKENSHNSTRGSRIPYYEIYYKINGDFIKQSFIEIPVMSFDKELREWFRKIADIYRFETYFYER